MYLLVSRILLRLISSAAYKLARLSFKSLVDSSNEEFAAKIMVARTREKQRALVWIVLFILTSCWCGFFVFVLYIKTRVLHFYYVEFSGVVEDPLKVYAIKGTALHLTFHDVKYVEELVLFSRMNMIRCLLTIRVGDYFRKE